MRKLGRCCESLWSIPLAFIKEMFPRFYSAISWNWIDLKRRPYKFTTHVPGVRAFTLLAFVAILLDELIARTWIEATAVMVEFEIASQHAFHSLGIAALKIKLEQFLILGGNDREKFWSSRNRDSRCACRKGSKHHSKQRQSSLGVLYH